MNHNQYSITDQQRQEQINEPLSHSSVWSQWENLNKLSLEMTKSSTDDFSNLNYYRTVEILSKRIKRVSTEVQSNYSRRFSHFRVWTGKTSESLISYWFNWLILNSNHWFSWSAAAVTSMCLALNTMPWAPSPTRPRILYCSMSPSSRFWPGSDRTVSKNCPVLWAGSS